MSTRKDRISAQLNSNLKIEHLEIEDESSQHSGPRIETHFKVLVVSSDFEGKSRVERQRLINQALAEEFSTGLHALSQRTLTPKEWQSLNPEDFNSPLCVNRNKDN